METFTWLPRTKAKGKVGFNTLSAQFNDGYAQFAQDGINSRTESWPLEFFGKESEIKPIKDFLDQHGEWKRFLWSPPMGREKPFRARGGYELVPLGGGWYTLSVTFSMYPG
ncbi:phage tail protein [Achromobacter insolitus]|uniref:phage tail protein n=1 Tax=Achromobacter insolitus TaxID=217204 RepID=UPI0011EA8B7A|nr:phage tail protein [Achromobacter insolitus]QEK91910.1 phage tail protein [Achromobacter insolitus]